MADIDPLMLLLATGQLQQKNYTPADEKEADIQNRLLNMQLAEQIPPTVRSQSNVVMPKPGAQSPLLPGVKSEVVQTRGPIGDKDRYDALSELYNSKVQEGLLGQEQGIAQLEQFRNNIAASPVQVDLSPLAAYIDSTVEGSQLSKGYARPENAESKQHRLMGYENEIQKAKMGLSDKEIDAMKAALQNSMYSKAIQAQGRNERFGQSQELKKEDTLRKDLNKEITDPMQDDLQKFEMIESGLGSGEYVKVVNSLSNFSRSVAGEKGVLTDADINRVLPRNFQGSLAKFEEYFRTTDPTQVDPAYTKSLVELTQLAKQKAGAKYKNTLRGREKQYGAPGSSYQSTMQGAGRFMFDDLKEQIDTYFGAQPAGGNAGGGSSKEQRLKELRAKKAAAQGRGG